MSSQPYKHDASMATIVYMVVRNSTIKASFKPSPGQASNKAANALCRGCNGHEMND